MQTNTLQRQRDQLAQSERYRGFLSKDIGECPECENPPRVALCRRNFRAFCDHYFAAKFSLEWSPDHRLVIKQIEAAILEGGLFATAMPRGSGKTTLCETACLWALLYGHRSFVALIGSDESHAAGMLQSIKIDLETNDQLYADFPKITHPIRALEGISLRARGQMIGEERTRIGWTAGELVLPSVDGSPASGSIVKTAGLTGSFRGLKHSRDDGSVLRPELVLIDDPQTDESARSPSQCDTRERILAGAILGLAGPGKKISGLLPCTVIAPGDMADRILNRAVHPDWNGTRTKLIYSFPSSPLWDDYALLRAQSLQAGNGGKEATEFYKANRGAMDEGAKVAWPSRFNHDEASAIQHAINLKLRDERAFYSEYQNEPLPLIEEPAGAVTADEIAGRINRHDRQTIPLECGRLTAFIDVQQKLLYYVVCAWTDDFSGAVIDYGTYPDQHIPYFALEETRITLAKTVPAAGLEGQIHGGLAALCAQILGRDWMRDDGAPVRIERCLIDANWGQSTDTVYQFVRQSAHAAVLMPSHGRYVGASSVPMRDYTKKPGDRLGLNWRVPNVVGRRTVRYVNFDTNFWKSFVVARFKVALGDRGALTLFGSDPKAHRMFADHCVSEYRVRTTGRGREVDEWKIRPERPDNHLWDCLVGCAVAASIQGARIAQGEPGGGASPGPRKQVSFSEMYAAARKG